MLEAVLRIGKRALKNRLMVALAALAFVAIFFLAVPFPIIIVAAALVGFFAQRFKLAEFQNSSAHAPGSTAKSDAAGSLLGDV